jgi:subtilisin family serine protease
VTSNPSGLSVLLDGSSVGNTAVNVQPGPAAFNHTIVVAGTYSVTVAQTQNGGTQSIFYNQASDTSGSLNASSIQSVLRDMQGTRAIPAGAAIRLPVRIAGRTGLSQTMLYVHYSRAALQAAGRRSDDVERAVGAAQSAQIGTNGDDQLNAVAVPAGRSVDDFAASLRAQSGVTSTEPVHLRYAVGTTPKYPNNCHFGAPGGLDATCPNLVGSNQQWDMLGIATSTTAGTFAPNAWAYSGAINSGSNVKIAVIDTGYDCAHAGAADGLTANVAFQESIISGVVNTGTCAAQDTDGHGTNVSGVADAVTNPTSGVGFAGVAWNASLLEYRIFPPGQDQSAATSDEALAINDAVSRGAKVINLSLGGSESLGVDTGEQTAVEQAIAAGVTVVAAAGNDGATTVDYPGAYAGVISVGASAIADGQANGAGNTNGSATAPIEYVASYSNFGPGLGLLAPGGDPNGSNDGDTLHWVSNLYSTANSTSPCRPSGQPDGICAVEFAGTSQATPHVSGAVALMLAVKSSLSVSAITNYLFSTADDICRQASYSCPASTTQEGHGRLNLYRLLAAVTGDSSPPSYKPATNQFIAFAYTNSGSTGAPKIIDVTYPNGVPVSSSGTFRIADVPAGTTSYKIGVWYNLAGNGVVSPGDDFGAVSCSGSGPCSASNITLTKLTSNVIP